eukprot:m.11432 g.11432  ORF g.11432 m.11432 type:complete len:70 (-) comp8580_c0_seq1:1379-1588(-)
MQMVLVSTHVVFSDVQVLPNGRMYSYQGATRDCTGEHYDTSVDSSDSSDDTFVATVFDFPTTTYVDFNT